MSQIYLFETDRLLFSFFIGRLIVFFSHSHWSIQSSPSIYRAYLHLSSPNAQF
jgi:hypothetical protein